MTGTTEPPGTGGDDRRDGGGWPDRLVNRARLLASSVRTRILVGYVALLALAVVGTFAVGRQVLLADVNERIDSRLSVVVTEVRGIARRDDAVQREPFADRVRRILRAYLRNNFPPRDGTLLTLVGGEPFLRDRGPVPYRVDRDQALVARWAGLGESDRGSAPTPAGPIEYLAVPLRAQGRTQGVFVAVVFRDPAQAELDEAIKAVGAIGLGALVLGSALAWQLAGGVLRPVTTLSDTTRAISETDLSRRIPVSGNDEVAQLGTRFNAMLDRLEAAFAGQRRLVDDAGHELRTPITIVRGHLELLGDDPEERRETIELVLDELDRMSRLVDDLLLLAKAEQPDFLKLETVDIAALTAELYAKSEALAQRDWRLEERGEGIVVADRQRLTQAMIQLAHNATRHTAEGDRIGLGSSVEEGEARLWVRDSGSGIAIEEQGQIFERFARGSQGPRTEGAGLGLAIVKAIIEAHHGDVEVHSRPGAGATFTLVLPVDQPLGQPSVPAPSRPTVEHEPPRVRG